MTGTSTNTTITQSDTMYTEAQSLIPGGVNSPVRAFRSVGGVPRFIERGSGAYLYDVDGNRYIDYVLSWGPLVLGHAYPAVVEAITQQAQRGTSFGAPTELETKLAQAIIRAIPSVEMVRFVNSGTEATMSALRLARAATGRNKIIKFAGCYHGHADALLVQAGSGVATLGLPDSPGVTPGAAADTLSAAYNDLAATEALFTQNHDQIAAVIVEPVAGNMGFVLPQPGFLKGLRRLCSEHGALLIFDEVMTGFRVSAGGAQAHYGITPDITCLGKVIGGGLPVGAYGGSRAVMQHVAPAGSMYQAGTLSGNPLAMAAGIVTLQQMDAPGFFDRIAQTATRVVEMLQEQAQRVNIPVQAASAGSMWGFFFADAPVTDYASARHNADTNRYARFFHAMLESGVYLAPSQFEAGFVSSMHDDTILVETEQALVQAFSRINV